MWLKFLNSYTDYKYVPRDVFVFVKMKAVKVNRITMFL